MLDARRGEETEENKTEEESHLPTNEQMIATMAEIIAAINQERARSPDGKTERERRLAHMSLEDWFKPFTV